MDFSVFRNLRGLFQTLLKEKTHLQLFIGYMSAYPLSRRTGTSIPTTNYVRTDSQDIANSCTHPFILLTPLSS